MEEMVNFCRTELIVCNSVLEQKITYFQDVSIQCRSQWPRGLGIKCLRLLEHWDRRFESHSMHGCPFAFILCLC
jgi:hypothetical protein